MSRRRKKVLPNLEPKEIFTPFWTVDEQKSILSLLCNLYLHQPVHCLLYFCPEGVIVTRNKNRKLICIFNMKGLQITRFKPIAHEQCCYKLFCQSKSINTSFIKFMLNKSSFGQCINLHSIKRKLTLRI